MYKVVGSRASRVFRVLWMLEEIGAPYTHIPASARSDEVKAINPSGKIPVLVIDDVTITDSVAIMTYLGDVYGVLTHSPGTLDRARQDALTLQILDEIDSALWIAARHSFILPVDKRIPEIKPAMKLDYAQNLARLSEQFEGPFLMGDRLTIPDILLTHCLRWAEIAKFPEPNAKMADYKARMEAREAYQKTAAME